MKKHGCRGTHRPRSRRMSRSGSSGGINLRDAEMMAEDAALAEAEAAADLEERRTTLVATALPTVIPSEGEDSMSDPEPDEVIDMATWRPSAYDGAAMPGGGHVIEDKAAASG